MHVLSLSEAAMLHKVGLRLQDSCAAKQASILGLLSHAVPAGGADAQHQPLLPSEAQQSPGGTTDNPTGLCTNEIMHALLHKC